MKTVSKNNNFVSYLLLILSLCVLFFVTKNVFADLQIHLDTFENQKRELTTSKEKLDTLNILKKDLLNEQNIIKQTINPFIEEPTEQDILDFFYSYADEQNRENDVIIFRGINISEPTQNDIWLREMNINLSTIFAGESTLFAFLNMLMSAEIPYNFYISDFDYPMNENSGNIQTDIPLTVYFK